MLYLWSKYISDTLKIQTISVQYSGFRYISMPVVSLVMPLTLNLDWFWRQKHTMWPILPLLEQASTEVWSQQWETQCIDCKRGIYLPGVNSEKLETQAATLPTYIHVDTDNNIIYLICNYRDDRSQLLGMADRNCQNMTWQMRAVQSDRWIDNNCQVWQLTDGN